MSEEALVHSTSVVDEGVLIGRGTRVWHFCHIMPGSRIGEDCVLENYVFVGRGVTIGNGVKIQNQVSIFEGVTLEDGVFCGPSMTFTNVIHPRSFIDCQDEVRPTLARRGATIGANATVLCGVTLGRYSFCGAGSVITHDVPDFGLVYGNPGKLMGWICRCGRTLGSKVDTPPDDLHCTVCERRYRREGDRLIPEGTV